MGQYQVARSRWPLSGAESEARSFVFPVNQPEYRRYAALLAARTQPVVAPFLQTLAPTIAGVFDWMQIATDVTWTA